MPIAVITLAESGRFAIAQYPEGVAVSPHCSYLPIAIIENFPAPESIKHSILAFEFVVAPMFHATG